MKLLVKDYLKGLRERDELDRLLPDLLSEMGLHVFMIPQQGPRQFGVDCGAVGRLPRGAEKRLYLFVIKCGDITKGEWSREGQGVRASIEECFDVYIPRFVPPEYVHLPVTICICCGGDVRQEISPNVDSYKAIEGRKHRCEIKTWNGDYIAGLIAEHFCNTKLFVEGVPSELLRSLAMVTESDVSFQYFRTLTNKFLEDTTKVSLGQKLSRVRQLNLCLGMLFSWGEKAKNLDAPYLAAELVLVRVWRYLGVGSKSSKLYLRKCIDAYIPTLRFYIQIAMRYVQRVQPYLTEPYLFAFSASGNDEVDVNCKTFDVLGRLAATGCMIYCFAEGMKDAWQGRNAQESANAKAAIQLITDCIVHMLKLNPTSNWALQDDYAGTIALVCAFLGTVDKTDVIRGWLLRIIATLQDYYRRGKIYPVARLGYRKLLEYTHQGRMAQEEYAKYLPSSELLPTLALISNQFDCNEAYDALVDIQENVLRKCNFQLLFYENDVEDAATGKVGGNAGIVLHSICLRDRVGFLKSVRAESKANGLKLALPGLFQGVLFVGLHHYGMPLPPGFMLSPDQDEAK